MHRVRLVTGLVLLVAAGCSWKIPTPEQRAQLAEIARGVEALTAELDASAAEIKAVVDGVRDGSVEPSEAATRLAALYARKGEVEKRLLALQAQERSLRAQGVSGFFVALSAALGVASALLGGRARALALVGTALSRTLEKAKAGDYADGDTAAEIEKAGASASLAESVRRAAG